MNRLQKKCVIATAGFHLLLLVILFVGPAFFSAKPKTDDSQVLDVISANLVDAAINNGVKNATPPMASPPQSQPQPQPTPPAPKPVVQPAPTPQPTITERLEKFFKSEPEKPATQQTENPPHTPKINLTPVTRVVPKNSTTPNKASPDNSKAIKSVLRALRAHLSSATEIAPVGNSSAAAANYSNVVKSIYEQAWTPPDDTASDEANVKVRVTIASDGTVISATIIATSGDASVDRSVQATLDRVQFIAPFPSGSTDTQRTYIINFNLKSKRQLG
jgi:colicin import membrane protein